MCVAVGLRNLRVRRVRRVRRLWSPTRGNVATRLAALDARTGFEDQHVHAAARQRVAGQRAGDARADDDDVGDSSTDRSCSARGRARPVVRLAAAERVGLGPRERLPHQRLIVRDHTRAVAACPRCRETAPRRQFRRPAPRPALASAASSCAGGVDDASCASRARLSLPTAGVSARSIARATFGSRVRIAGDRRRQRRERAPGCADCGLRERRRHPAGRSQRGESVQQLAARQAAARYRARSPFTHARAFRLLEWTSILVRVWRARQFAEMAFSSLRRVPHRPTASHGFAMDPISKNYLIRYSSKPETINQIEWQFATDPKERIVSNEAKCPFSGDARARAAGLERPLVAQSAGAEASCTSARRCPTPWARRSTTPRSSRASTLRP